MVNHYARNPARKIRASGRDDALDLLFHALADRTRRTIITRLAEGPASVSELAAPFSMTLPAVSKHIRVLERARLVSRKPSGGVQRCALTGAPFVDAAAWIEANRALWEDALDALARYAETDGDKQ
jgi:DNA-binding transcriptional ArsR family regulator